MVSMRTLFVAEGLLIGLLAAPLFAREIELQMVRYDQPDVTLDQVEKSAVVNLYVATEKGWQVKTAGKDTVCWSRNVLLDGEPLFERYYEGKYVSRLPRVKKDVPPGRHVIWPGDHAFTVKPDGALEVESPELLVAGDVLKIKAYPVTIRANLANPEGRGAVQARRNAVVPSLTIRDATELAESGKLTNAAPAAGAVSGLADKGRELLPLFASFCPLTIYLPANRGGRGYAIHPLGITFQVGTNGIAVGAGGGAPPMQGIGVGKWEVDIPVYALPVTGVGGCTVPGMDVTGYRGHVVYFYPRPNDYEVRFTPLGAAMTVDGNIMALPLKALHLDVDPAINRRRGVLLEIQGCHFKPGETVALRFQGLAEPAPTNATVAAVPPETAVPDRRNSLTNAVPFAQVRLYGESAWTGVPLTIGADGRGSLAIPEIADGLYRLEIGLRPRDSTKPPISVERWITVAGARSMGVGLFTQRARNAFYRGEEFWIGVGMTAIGQPIPAGTPVTVELVDAEGRRLALLQKAPAAPVKERETFIVRMDGAESLKLAPGHYRVEATLGAVSARPFPLDVVDPEPRTHFDNIMIGKYSNHGSQYENVILTGRGADELVRDIVSLGCNGFVGMAYDMDRVVQPDAKAEQLVRERPELGPWEAYGQPSGRDRFLNAAVRHNLRFWEDLFTYHDTSLPRGDGIIAACVRYAALEVRSMQHSPAFQGVCLYDEIYNRALNDDGVGVVASFDNALELGYRARNPGLTSAAALKALDRYAGRPFGQRSVKDLEIFRTYPAYQDEGWRIWCDRLAGAARTVMPSSRNLTLYRYWGGNGSNIGLHGKEEDVFGSLDYAACVMYKDGGYGDHPVFGPMHADVLRVADSKPVWTQLHNGNGPGIYDQHILRQAFFGLSKKIDGFSYFMLSPDRDAVRNIADGLCTPYGDFFLSLTRSYRQVGIYYSRTAQYLGPRKPNSLSCQVEGLWVACARSGFPAGLLRDGDILAGRGMEYQAVFVPGFTYEDECPPDILAALQRLVNAGKTLLVEKSSRLPIEGIVRLDSELDDYDDKLGGAFPRYVDFPFESVFDQTDGLTRLVAEALAKRVPPAARHNLLVGPDWLQRGEGRYMILPNFDSTAFSGLHRTLYQAPDRPRVEFPRQPPVCYDVLEMKQVDVKTDGDWMSVEADMSHYPGKILAFLPESITSVRLAATPTVTAGSLLSYSAAVLGPQGKPIDAAFPVKVRITDSAGKCLKEVYRAAAPEFQGTYAVPVNVAPGPWRVHVTELVSGAAAEATVAVNPGATLATVQDTRQVRMTDPVHLAGFLAHEDREIEIIVSEAQDWVRPVAERLRQTLVKRGLKAAIWPAENTVVVHEPTRFNVEKPVFDGTRLWRGEIVLPGFFVDNPVIVLGKRGENILIDALIDRDLLSEPPSANFPGPGRAVVAWTYRAFSATADAVSILSEDADGLSAGVDAFLAADGKAAANPAPRRLLGTTPAATGLAPGQSAAKEIASFADRLRGEDRVVSLDLDPKTGRVLAGAFGYGDNLFCLGPDGKLLWKTYLPEHNVYFARWYDDGKRVVAATGRGWFVFLMDGADGKVLRKFAATEWPDAHIGEGAIDTQVQIELNPALRQIVVAGRTGLMAVDHEGRKMWFVDRAPAIVSIPKEADRTMAAGEVPTSAALGNFAVSPDGTRLVCGEYRLEGTTIDNKELRDVWVYRPRILDARNGQVLSENTNDVGTQMSPSGWSVRWPAESKTPWVDTAGLTAPLGEDGTRGTFIVHPGVTLPGGDQLVISGSGVERRSMQGTGTWRGGFSAASANFRQPWRAADLEQTAGEIYSPELDRLALDMKRLYRGNAAGEVVCVDLDKGDVAWRRTIPFCSILRPTPDGVVAGTLNGGVVRLGANGAPLWQVSLRALHEPPVGDYAAYVRAGRQRDADSTPELYPVSEDKPGDYDAILRFGVEQLDNGGCEQDGAWSVAGKPPLFGGLPHQGQRALRCQPGAVVTQSPDRRVVPLGTYLLEFFYRPQAEGAQVTAGAVLTGEGETFTASTWSGPTGAWHFARLAIKAMEATRTLQVGFEATGGEVLVDDVSLKPVRFPSANMLANPALHAVEPTFVSDIRVRFNRIPSDLKQSLMSANHMVAFKQGSTQAATIYTEEEAFLHNGRLDDVGATWIYPPDLVGFGAVLMKPAWVSHLVLYLNNTRPEDAYGTIAILANNLETKMPEVVALVRNNRRRFVVVYFPKPVFTDVLKILPGHLLQAHRECLTEVEVYGPSGGPDAAAAKGFPADPVGWPMLMASPAHVPAALPADLTGDYRVAGTADVGHPAFLTGAIAAKRLLVYGDPNGALRSLRFMGTNAQQRVWEGGPSWGIGTITPITVPAWHAGRFLVGSADEKMHAVAENGEQLWAFRTGGRVYSAATPSGDDVFFGSDDGSLYKVDADSGILLWEFKTGGKVRAAPALAEGRVVVPSWDGFLYAINAESGRPLWKAPIAPYTRAAPAVQGDRVYLGDEDGHMRGFLAGDGKPVFDQVLGGRIAHCPVVAADGILFASEQGSLGFVGADGQVKWTRKLGAEVTGQPIGTRSQLLIPTTEGMTILRQADGQPDDRVRLPEQPGRTLAAVPYGDRLCLVAGGAWTLPGEGYVTYAGYGAKVVVWAPPEPAKPEGGKP